jgi:hypothetical protein
MAVTKIDNIKKDKSPNAMYNRFEPKLYKRGDLSK